MSVAPGICSEATAEEAECDEEEQAQNELATQAQVAEEERQRKREESRLVRVKNATEMRALSTGGRNRALLQGHSE